MRWRAAVERTLWATGVILASLVPHVAAFALSGAGGAPIHSGSPGRSVLSQDLGSQLVRQPPQEGYSPSLASLNEQARSFERDPANRYTYCIRATATYECLSYAADGQVRKQHASAEAHGTGVAYQQVNGETFLLTNHHVAEWPAVTGPGHMVEDVPAGCKLASSSLKIVDNDHDDYAEDDIGLTRVVSDEELDAAIVKAHTSLRTMPYRVGKSALLKAGDAVVVQGFPLGAFRAITAGQVINPHDHDDYGNWNHDDFIIDAALSPGNSGSPVLAVSQRTGEYELVGIFHANYSGGNALNAVIGIEQLRDLMVTLKRPQHLAWTDRRSGPEQRAGFLQALGRPAFVPFLQLGSRTVSVRAFGDALLYEIYASDFPLAGKRDLLIVDEPAQGSFGEIGQVWVRGDDGFRMVGLSGLDSDSQGALAALLKRLHGLSNETVVFRAMDARAASSRAATTEFAQFRRAFTRASAGDGDLAQSIDDLSDALRAHLGQDPVPLEGIWAELESTRSGGGLASAHAQHPPSEVSPAAAAGSPPRPGGIAAPAHL